jgi:two-component system cell cycle response regulator
MTDRSGTALVVDDDFLNRTLLATSLEEQGHVAEMAEDGEQALEMLAEHAYYVVLLDVLMPGIDGYQVLQRMKQEASWRDIPVIMISALDELASVVKGIELGAEDYLPKPFDPVLLRARLNACLQKKWFRDKEVEYLQQVQRVTGAAAAVETGAFEPDSLDEVAGREDALGQLARVFQRMAREVAAREQSLKRQVQELRIQIDETKKAREVAEITESDYFRDLAERARHLRGASAR